MYTWEIVNVRNSIALAKISSNRLGVVPYVDLITHLTSGSCNENMLFILSFHLICAATFVTVRELMKRYSTMTA